MKIFDYVGNVFQTHRNAHEPITHPGHRPGFGRQSTMSSGGWVGNGAFGIAQIGGNRQERRGVDELPRSGLAAFYVK